VAETKDSKKTAGKKAERSTKAAEAADSLGPPVGAAAETSALKPKSATPVAIGGDSIVDRLLPHVKKIIAVVVVAAVVVMAFFSVVWYRQRNAEKASLHVANAVEILRRDVTPAPAEGQPPPPAQPGKEPGFDSYQTRAEAAIAALKQAGSAEAAAALLEASLQLQAGKIDAAEAIYRQHSVGTSLDAVLAREGLGYVAERRAAAITDPAQRQQALEGALKAFRAMQTDDKGPRRDFALYHEARILMLLDKNAEAKAALEKALELPSSDIKSDIQQRLAQIAAITP